MINQILTLQALPHKISSFWLLPWESGMDAQSEQGSPSGMSRISLTFPAKAGTRLHFFYCTA